MYKVLQKLGAIESAFHARQAKRNESARSVVNCHRTLARFEEPGESMRFRRLQLGVHSQIGEPEP